GGGPYSLDLNRMDANGGWIAKPIDLLLFLRRIDGDSAQADLLQTASLTDMHTPSGTPGQGRGYGLGLIVNHFGGPTTDYEWGHNGAMDGTISFLIHRDDGMAFAVTCNTRPAGDGYCGQLRSLID